MKRKQRSGAQNRRIAKAKAQAAGVLMPSAPPLAELSSLTGVIREKGRNYRNWKLGKIPHEQYLVSIRGLSALAAALTAREAERQCEIDEQILRSLESLDAKQSGMPLIELPATGAPLVGEFIPRGTSDDEVNS
jgi:hypothetical protein